MKYRILFLSALAVLMFSGSVFAGTYAGTDDLVLVSAYSATGVYNLTTGALVTSVPGYWYADHGISTPYTNSDLSSMFVMGCNPRIDGWTPLSTYNSRSIANTGGFQLIDVGSQYLCLAIDNDWEGAAKAYVVDSNRLVRVASDLARLSQDNYNATWAAAVAPEAFTDVGQSYVNPGNGTWSNPSAYSASNFADVEVIGQDVYWTMGKGTGAAKLFIIGKNFLNGATRTEVLDATAMQVAGATEARGFTLDAQGSIYLIINSTTVAKFNSNGSLNNAAFLTGIDLTDIDYINGKLILAGSTGGQVYNADLSGGLLNTLPGLTSVNDPAAHGLEVIPGVQAGTTFTGTVNLLGWMGASLPSVSVVVDGGAPVATALTAVDADTGTFTVSLPATASHTVQVKAAVTLSQTQSGTTPAFSSATFNLQCGDNTGDNVIDDFDFNAVITNFGSGAGGDGNGDAATDDFDFNLVITNFGSTGS
jgi:hypothetical protein